MLKQAVDNYLALRRACGYKLIAAGFHLRSFAAFSETRGQHHVCAATAIEWAGLGLSVYERAARLATVIRFTRHLRAEDPKHELPPPVYGRAQRPRPVPYSLSLENVQKLVAAAAQCGWRPTLRRDTYSTLFSLLACTGLRVSEAIALRYADITPDGLLIRQSKYRKYAVSQAMPITTAVNRADWVKPCAKARSKLICGGIVALRDPRETPRVCCPVDIVPVCSHEV